MKHARKDYDRIQDPAGLIPENEPVVLLRGQDKLATPVLEYYASLCEAEGAVEIAKHIREHIELMIAWPKKKVPDMPEGV
jgi:hypothetical protein